LRNKAKRGGVPGGVPASIDEEEAARQSQLDLNVPFDRPLLVDVPPDAPVSTSGGMTVHRMRTWDVKMSPFKKSMVGGHLVPTVKGAVHMFIRKKRRVSIEVRGPTTEADVSAGGGGRRERKKKPTSPGKGDGAGGAIDGAATTTELADDEVLFLRVFKRRKNGDRHDQGGDGDADDVSVDESVAVSEADATVEGKSYH